MLFHKTPPPSPTRYLYSSSPESSPSRCPSSSPETSPSRRRPRAGNLRRPLGGLLRIYTGVILMVSIISSFICLHHLEIHRQTSSLRRQPFGLFDPGFKIRRRLTVSDFPRTVVLDDFLGKPFPSHQQRRPNTLLFDSSEVDERFDLVPMDDTGIEFASRGKCPTVRAENGEMQQCVPHRILDASPLFSCNEIHSIDFRRAVTADSNAEASLERFLLTPKAQGGTRIVWEFQDRMQNEVFALKTLRSELPLSLEHAELQQLDAMAMEQLTSSPRVLDIYGFCGQTSVSEYASRTAPSLLHSGMSNADKVEFAIDIARGIADLHEISDSGHLAFVHGDITLGNFALTEQGEIKLNDFNAGYLQCWNKRQTCGYLSDEEFGGDFGRRVDVRAPEELNKLSVLSEKTDVYAFGSVLYKILTNQRMYNCTVPGTCPLGRSILSDEEVRERILAGSLPTLPDEVNNTESVAMKALRDSMYDTLNFDAEQRPSARAIANRLSETLSSLKSQSNVFLAGMISDVTAMPSSRLDQLVELNCRYGVGIHILAAEVPENWTRIDELRSEYPKCSPFVAMRQKSYIADLYPNRIDRYAYLRDVQRTWLRDYWEKMLKYDRDHDRDAIVLLDLDLYRIPTNEEISMEISRMIQDPDSADVVCAAGQMVDPYGYYDIFSTVLTPQTFVFPTAGRLIDRYMSGEDPTLVRSDDAYGSFTQWDLMNYFEHKASTSADGTVPVRSCFGGLAIYRASTYFMPECKYSLNSKNLMEFANKEDGRPCEHVVFHNCLLKNDLSTYIAVKPSLKTTWGTPAPQRSEMRSGRGVGSGLFTSAKDPSRGSQLVNGTFSLRINQEGSLVVENTTSSNITWRADTETTHLFHEKWDSMFLVLKEDGQLVLIQQLEMVRSEVNPELCQLVDEIPKRSCRIEIWTSGVAGSQSNNYELSLAKSGEIQVREQGTARVLWSNKGGIQDPFGPKHDVDVFASAMNHDPDVNASDSHQDILQSQWASQDVVPHADCLASGDEQTINKVLQGNASAAVLCQRSTFHLNGPIVFTDDYQTLYTHGNATGSERALIVVSNRSLATAINMVGRSHVELRDVIIDGNREQLGHVSAQFYGGGLIDAGGPSATDQVVSGVKAYDPRSWTCLHVLEGLPEEKCERVVIEHSEFGPAGSHDGVHDEVADGISFACTDGIIRRNVIQDVTDGGIVIFGAPGTVVEDNIIRATTRTLFGGINMVDYAPYGGDYTDTVIQRNLIDAAGAMINVGLGMGGSIWQCPLPNMPSIPYLFGATVSNNTLQGNHMGYGFAIHGVKFWTVFDNKDLSQHVGTPNVDCNGELPSSPDGFQIVPSTSGGFFQDDFKKASLTSIATTLTEGKSKETHRLPSGRPGWSNETLREAYPLSVVDQTSE